VESGFTEIEPTQVGFGSDDEGVVHETGSEG